MKLSKLTSGGLGFLEFDAIEADLGLIRYLIVRENDLNFSDILALMKILFIRSKSNIKKSQLLDMYVNPL